jgi:dsDNA-specific endonuclease/ATPase MutS2
MRDFRASVGRLSTAAIAAALLFAAPLAAQGPPVQQDQMQMQMPDSVQEMITEAQAIQQEVQQLQMQAMEENEELQVMRDQLSEMVRAAVSEIEPEFDQLIERMGELEQEFMAAQQSQDQEALQQLQMEATQVQTRLQTAEQQAMEQPQIQEEIEVFEDELMAEMTLHDPDAPQKMERLEELAARIEAAMDGVG